MSTNEGFLSRWSRRKHDSRNAGDADRDAQEARDAPPGDAPADAQTRPGGADARTSDPALQARASDPAPQARVPVPAAGAGDAGGAMATTARDPGDADTHASVTPQQRDEPVPELPPVDSLTPQSDFRPFMQTGVDAATRNAALAKLFADPHFNVMDGLDVYIDDYNKTEPIPPTMLAKLQQLHAIGWSDDEIERWTREGGEGGEPAEAGKAGEAGEAGEIAEAGRSATNGDGPTASDAGGDADVPAPAQPPVAVPEPVARLETQNDTKGRPDATDPRRAQEPER